MNPHGLTSILDGRGELVIVFARAKSSRWVIVDAYDDSSVTENRFTHDNANIDGSLSDAANGDSDIFYEPVVRVQITYPKLFMVEVAEPHAIVVICSGGGGKFRLHVLRLTFPTLSEFHTSENP